jgi:SAM-dependent methyltransferase
MVGFHRLMDGYGAATYGDQIADVYDDFHTRADTDATMARLCELSGGGPALELAIGTGRIALPLAERGIQVDGIDASEAMVAQLRAKPGGAALSVAIGDFADVDVPGEYRLVFVVFNTLFALLTQDDQVRCFENVARHLTPEGVFVIEVFVPDLTRFTRHQHIGTTAVAIDSVRVDASRHDPVAQRTDTNHVIVGPEGVRTYPVAIRYAWPSELDLMARLAGLELRDRWSGWNDEPFTADSGNHVSVYRRIAT